MVTEGVDRGWWVGIFTKRERRYRPWDGLAAEGMREEQSTALAQGRLLSTLLSAESGVQFEICFCMHAFGVTLGERLAGAAPAQLADRPRDRSQTLLAPNTSQH